MNKFALALVGAAISATATAQTSESLIAGSTVTTTVVTAIAPVILLGAITLSAENNDTPTAPQTTPSTSTSTR